MESKKQKFLKNQEIRHRLFQLRGIELKEYTYAGEGDDDGLSRDDCMYMCLHACVHVEEQWEIS